MPDYEQLAIIKKGSEVWNKWRNDNQITPDLRNAKLSGANLSNANLRRTWLGRADLSKARLNRAQLQEAHLQTAKLEEANLKGANLKGAKLREAELFEANLNKADLSEAILTKADLSYTILSDAKLCKANLTETDLSYAELQGADFTRAIFYKTIITSRTELTCFKFPLTDEQKSGIIFADEKAEAASKRMDKKLKNYPCLTIEFQNDISWKNEWLAFLLLAIQISYNNCFYLSSTKDKNIEIIKTKLKKQCEVSARNDIEINLIKQDSPLIIQYVQYALENAPQVATVLASLGALILAISKSYKNFMEGKKAKKESLKIDEEKRKIQVETEEKQFALTLQKVDHAKELMEKTKEELEYVSISTSNDVVSKNKCELLFLASNNLQVVLAALDDTADIGNIFVRMGRTANGKS